MNIKIRISESNICFERKCLMWIMVLGPILRIYASPIPGINYFELFAFMCLIIDILKYQQIAVVSIKNPICIFVLFSFIYTMGILCCSLFFNLPFSIIEFLKRFLRWAFYSFLIGWFASVMDFKYAKKCFIKVACVVCLLLFIQLIIFYTTHSIVSFKIPGLPISGNEIMVNRQMDIAESHVFRAYSVFLEPAHFAYFVAPALAVELLLEDKRNYLVAIFLTIGLLFCSSSTGILLSAIIWIFYMIYVYAYEKKMKFKPRYLLFLILFILGVYWASNLSFVQYGLDKLFIGDGSHEIAKTSRLYGHMKYVDRLDLIQKIFGIGIGNEEFFFLKQFNVKVEYMNTWGYLLINIGYIGLIIFILMYSKLFFNVSVRYRIFIFTFIGCTISSGILFSSNAILFLVWPIYDLKSKIIKDKRLNKL